MKVIKPGDGRKGWAKQYSCIGKGGGGGGCGGCGAILLVEIGDLFQTTQCCRDEVDYFVTFRCPECGVLTDVPEGHLPAGTLARNLPKRGQDRGEK